jgi:aminopeptidase N
MTSKRLVWVSMLLGACGGGSGGGSPDASIDGGAPDANAFAGSAEYEVSHYDMTIDMTTLHARTRVDLQTTTDGGCLTIGFRPPAAGAVTIDGEPAGDVTVDVTRAELTACGSGWPAGTPIELEVEYDVPETTWLGSQVGYSEWTDLSGGIFQYMVSWVGGCDRHGPCDGRPDRFATYRFDVTHAPNTEALCPGDVNVLEPGHTACTFDHDGGPTYSTFALMTSPSWISQPIGVWSGVNVRFYDIQGSGTLDALEGDRLAEQLAWMIDRFGPYPYGDELRLVVAPTYWAGFEHPGNIVLSEELATSTSSYANGLTHTTMHEIAHQWAGDHTTLADTYDFVWKEAMAEYLTFVFEDEHIAPDVARTTALAWKDWSTYSQFHLVPDERPALLQYYGDVYGPGPMILFRQLEVMYSRDAVLDAIAQLIGGDARAIGVADVQAALESTTGADLDGYFDAWVYGGGVPEYVHAVASWVPAAVGWDVSVQVTTADGVARGCAFTVQVSAESGATADLLFDLGPDGVNPGPINIPDPAFIPAGYVVDPYHECLVWKGLASTPRGVDGRPARDRTSIEPWRVSFAP